MTISERAAKLLKKYNEHEEIMHMSRQHHYLKISPKYFLPVEQGVKNFEVRFNDRNYRVGDMLHLREFADGEFTGREISKTVCYILDSSEYCKEGYVILGMK